MIDLSYPYCDIEAEFHYFWQKWKSPTGKTRKGTTQIDDIWQIFEENTVNNKSLADITRQQFGFGPKDHTTYNKGMAAGYRAVERARDKALAILKEIEKQAENRLR